MKNSDLDVRNLVKFTRGKIKEANIRAEFYKRCREAGLICYLQHTVFPMCLHPKRCVFDAVILHPFDGETNMICAIIEFKSRVNDSDYVKKETNQMQRYRKAAEEMGNIPIIKCNNWEEINTALGKAIDVVNDLIRQYDEIHGDEPL